jgi:hypothetical protein
MYIPIWEYVKPKNYSCRKVVEEQELGRKSLVFSVLSVVKGFKRGFGEASIRHHQLTWQDRSRPRKQPKHRSQPHAHQYRDIDDQFHHVCRVRFRQRLP